MLVAMVLFLGILGGINQGNNEMNLQQAGAGCLYLADEFEGGLSRSLCIAGGILTPIGVGMGEISLEAAFATTTNPYGWAYWVTTGIITL